MARSDGSQTHTIKRFGAQLADFETWWQHHAATRCAERFPAARAVQPIFMTATLPVGEYTPYVTARRTAQANRLVVETVRRLQGGQLPWMVLDSRQALWSRLEATWDGLHYIRTRQMQGGAKKMVLMMLLSLLRVRFPASAESSPRACGRACAVSAHWSLFADADGNEQPNFDARQPPTGKANFSTAMVRHASAAAARVAARLAFGADKPPSPPRQVPGDTHEHARI